MVASLTAANSISNWTVNTPRICLSFRSLSPVVGENPHRIQSETLSIQLLFTECHVRSYLLFTYSLYINPIFILLVCNNQQNFVTKKSLIYLELILLKFYLVEMSIFLSQTVFRDKFWHSQINLLIWCQTLWEQARFWLIALSLVHKYKVKCVACLKLSVFIVHCCRQSTSYNPTRWDFTIQLKALKPLGGQTSHKRLRAAVECHTPHFL